MDRTWPRLPIGLAGVAVLVFLISLATAPGKPDPERVADVVQDLGNAAGNRDGEEVCALLTDRYRTEVERRIPGIGCAEHVRSFGIGTPGDQLRDTPKEAPRLDGDRASVLLPGIGIRADLVRAGDGWRVDALAKVAARPVTPRR